MSVTRVEVDGATMLNKLGADKIIHDLEAPDVYWQDNDLIVEIPDAEPTSK